MYDTFSRHKYIQKKDKIPYKDISNLLTNTLISFEHTLYNYNATSYQTTNTTTYLNSMAYQESTKRFNTYHPSDLSSHKLPSPQLCDY